MIEIKLFDQYQNLLLKTHKSDRDERVEVNYSVYSTAHHYTLTDEQGNEVASGMDLWPGKHSTELDRVFKGV